MGKPRLKSEQIPCEQRFLVGTGGKGEGGGVGPKRFVRGGNSKNQF